MAEMAELEKQQKARGLLTEDAPMIKLALDAPPEVKKEDKPEPPPRPKAAFGENDDDDEMDGPKRKQRTLVKLEYDESDRKIETVNEAEQAARRNAKLLEVRNQIPRDKRRLWLTDIVWEAMTPVSVNSKMAAKFSVCLTPKSSHSSATKSRRRSVRRMKIWLISCSRISAIASVQRISSMAWIQ
jgi:hypothetical protein